MNLISSFVLFWSHSWSYHSFFTQYWFVGKNCSVFDELNRFDFFVHSLLTIWTGEKIASLRLKLRLRSAAAKSPGKFEKPAWKISKVTGVRVEFDDFWDFHLLSDKILAFNVISNIVWTWILYSLFESKDAILKAGLLVEITILILYWRVMIVTW